MISVVAPSQSRAKLVRAFGARKRILTTYAQWGTTYRDRSRPLVWFHAPSVGEGLMALPIIQRLRSETPTVQIAYTFFSPSAENFSRTLPVDFAEYLPFDTRHSVERVLDALRPTVLVFSKLDVWPTLTEQAHARGVKLGLTSASMPATSKRAHGIGSAFTHDAYAQLHRIGAASIEDAQALIDAGARRNRVRVTGDTRYDQAWNRARIVPRNQELRQALKHPNFTLVAGSTWPADEAVLFPTWIRIRQSIPNARLIIAPHEIHESHLRTIEQWAEQHALTVSRLDALDHEPPDVVIVDRMGVLADLYSVATVAYVGGGFHAHGLHSVVEPGVFHIPTIVGPRSTDSRDAKLLLSAGGLFVVQDADDMATTITQLASDEALRARTKHALAATISRELGATVRSFEIIRELLGPM